MAEVDHTALEVPPIRCGFCDGFPAIVAITVNYETARRVGLHPMFRAQCACGAIGKCRPTAEAAAEAWNEPWQALPPRTAAVDALAAMERAFGRLDGYHYTEEQIAAVRIARGALCQAFGVKPATEPCAKLDPQGSAIAERP